MQIQKDGNWPLSHSVHHNSYNALIMFCLLLAAGLAAAQTRRCGRLRVARPTHDSAIQYKTRQGAPHKKLSTSTKMINLTEPPMKWGALPPPTNNPAPFPAAPARGDQRGIAASAWMLRGPDNMNIMTTWQE